MQLLESLYKCKTSLRPFWFTPVRRGVCPVLYLIPLPRYCSIIPQANFPLLAGSEGIKTWGTLRTTWPVGTIEPDVLARIRAASLKELS